MIILGLAMATVFFVANGLFASLHPRLPGALSFGITAGNAVACWGCIRLAMAKGYPWYVGLVGIVSVLGVVVVGLILKDRRAAMAGGASG